MASSVSGTTDVPKVTQVQENQSSPKVAKQATNTNSANPQDTVTISSQARAAQQADQTRQEPDADQNADGK